MRILVTGGAGFIGSVIVKRALQQNFKVRAIDTLWYEQKVPLMHSSNPNYEFRKVDITNEASLDECLKGTDFVVHAAAVVGDPACKKFPDLTQKINYEGSLKLIKLAKENSVKGLIFLSTCSNYGVANGIANEDTTLQPLSLYAQTKVKIERYLVDVTRNFDWVICRLSTAYGPSPRMRFDLTVNDFTMNAFANNHLDVFLPYTYRPYIHVDNIGQIIVKMLEKFDLVKNNIFNIGFNEENYQKIQIVEIVKKYIPQMQFTLVDQGGDLRDYWVDFSKLYRYLGVKKTHTVEDGVKEILGLLNAGVINSSDPKYYNTNPRIEDSTLDPRTMMLE